MTRRALGPGLSRDDAHEVVWRIVGRWLGGPGRNDEITSVDSLDQLPDAVKQGAEQQGAEDWVVAVIHHGEWTLQTPKMAPNSVTAISA